MHYLRSKGLVGNHNTSPVGLNEGIENEICLKSNGVDGIANVTHLPASANVCPNGDSSITQHKPRLLVWSASDENALKRMIREYGTYYASRVFGHQANLDQLAYTLAARRSEMLWRACAVIDPTHKVGDNESFPTKKPVRSSIKKGLAFVFTGQGVQYRKMGMELLKYREFLTALLDAATVFENLGCTWSILGKWYYGRPQLLLS
jgi:acyl transferase domain-containing protein